MSSKVDLGNCLISHLIFYVELEDETWENEDILCEDPETPFIEEFNPTLVLDITLPVFDFSLIVDPTDPLYEDLIKVSKALPQEKLFNKIRL